MLLQVHFDTPTASGSPTEPSQLPFPQCCKTVTSRGHTSFASADHETESAACALYTCGKAARQCRRSRYCHTILHSEHSHDILLLDNEQSPIFFTISVTNPKVRGFLNGKLSGKKTTAHASNSLVVYKSLEFSYPQRIYNSKASKKKRIDWKFFKIIIKTYHFAI